jgi:hypothetical protein
MKVEIPDLIFPIDIYDTFSDAVTNAKSHFISLNTFLNFLFAKTCVRWRKLLDLDPPKFQK